MGFETDYKILNIGLNDLKSVLLQQCLDEKGIKYVYLINNNPFRGLIAIAENTIYVHKKDLEKVEKILKNFQ